MAVSNCEGDWELEFVCQGAEEASLDASYPASVVEVMDVELPPTEILLSWASAVLGLHLAGAKLGLFQPG